MIDREPRRLTEDEIVKRNIDLAFELAKNDALNDIPNKSTIVPIPVNDRVLAAHNMKLAVDLTKRIGQVYLVRIPMPTTNQGTPPSGKNH